VGGRGRGGGGCRGAFVALRLHALSHPRRLLQHTTWSGLENMMRLLKRYDLPFPVAGGGVPVPGRHTALSGFPGMLAYSSDDFYVLSSGLITLETTIDNNNKSA
jgi:hypothetical protein